MLGAIIGDIVGSRFEFGPAPEKGFKLFTDECNYTDDTICTIAIADAIMNKRDYGEALHDWWVTAVVSTTGWKVTTRSPTALSATGPP